MERREFIKAAGTSAAAATALAGCVDEDVTDEPAASDGEVELDLDQRRDPEGGQVTEPLASGKPSVKRQKKKFSKKGKKEKKEAKGDGWDDNVQVMFQ